MQKISFSSDQLPAHLSDTKKFDLWCDLHSAHVSPMDYRMADGPFRARLDLAQFGAAALGHMTGSLTHAAHGKAQASSPSRDKLGLLVNVGATQVHACSRNRQTTMLPGRAVLVSPIDAEQFTSDGAENDWLLIYVPKAAMMRATPGVEDMIGAALKPDNEALRMIRGYAGLAMRDVIAGPRLGEHVAQTLTDLVTLALGSERDAAQIATQRGLKAVRLEAILQAIATGYRDPAFSVVAVARKLRMSERYVQDLLHSTGSGFSERVLELRLQHATGLLSRASSAGRKISDIAFACGFNDLSYFHRCFRRRFGMSPGGARVSH